MSDKAWGGRFEQELDAIAARFSASVDVDGRLWPQDIDGSIAHVRMLADRNVLSKEDAQLIEAGLEVLVPEASVANPVDMVASATHESYRVALEIVLEDPQVDAAIAALP